MIYKGVGRRLVSGSWDGGMKIWNAGTGKQLKEYFFEGTIPACRLCEDGRILYIADAVKAEDHLTIHRLEAGDTF